MSPQAPRPRSALAARILLIPYLITLGLIVWLPASEASKATGIVFAFARSVSDLTSLDPITSATVFEFLANIVLFAPLGLLLMIAFSQAETWGVLLIGYSVSATIELVQTVLPSRYPTLSDVLANTLGTAIGCLLARVLIRAHRRRPTRVRPRSATFDETTAAQRGTS